VIDLSIVLAGKKEIIFDKAIEMIAEIGYENMSMRDLADAVDLRVASVYNHYAGKQEILDNIYDYYCEHMFDNRPTLEQSKRVIDTGDKDEVFETLNFNYVTDDEKKYKRMILTTKIVTMRIFNDERANYIFLELKCSEPAIYVKELLEYGISIGKIEMFDVDTYVNFMIGQRFFMGIKAYARPDYIVQQLDEEKSIMKMLKDFLPWIEKK
jgi:AcrR family transcriptional regulator